MVAVEETMVYWKFTRSSDGATGGVEELYLRTLRYSLTGALTAAPHIDTREGGTGYILGGGLVNNLPRPPQVIISKNRMQVPLGPPFWITLDYFARH